MKYSMVRQFSNASIDNIFTFFFKIVDFGKVMNEAFWAFLEIWIAFFLIFYNAIMYVYYLFLFVIDYSADESKGSYISFRRRKPGISHAPAISISKGPNPIPSMYGQKAGAATSMVSKSIRTAASSIKPAPVSSTAKKQWGKTILEGLSDFFSTIAGFFSRPFNAVGQFFGTRMKPVRAEDMPSQHGRTKVQGKSLIDEYIKEYEKKKR